MKTIPKQITEIVEAIAQGREDLFSRNSYENINGAIYWAWDNWDEYVLRTFYEGEKPENPTYEFRKDWLENELGNVPENWEGVFESFKGV